MITIKLFDTGSISGLLFTVIKKLRDKYILYKNANPHGTNVFVV